jgi:hypothetical protein
MVEKVADRRLVMPGIEQIDVRDVRRNDTAQITTERVRTGASSAGQIL